MTIIPYTLEDAHIDADIIVNHIQQYGTLPTTIVAITKGGLVPAYLIAERLQSKKNKIPIKCVGVSSYTGKKSGEVHFSDDSALILPKVNDSGKDYHLFIDDISATGKTLAFILGNFTDVETATLVTQEGTKTIPTFSGRRVEKEAWLDFFWDKPE